MSSDPFPNKFIHDGVSQGEVEILVCGYIPVFSTGVVKVSENSVHSNFKLYTNLIELMPDDGVEHRNMLIIPFVLFGPDFQHLIIIVFINK